MAEKDDVDVLEELGALEKRAAPKVVAAAKAVKKSALKVVTKPAPAVEQSSSEEEEEPETPVSKRKRTPAQIKAFERCLEIKREKAAKRLADAKKLAAFEKAALEDKVVAKAISIKKKQIKKQSALDEISDDETPIEKVVAKAKATAPKPVAAGPRGSLGGVAPAKPAFTFF